MDVLFHPVTCEYCATQKGFTLIETLLAVGLSAILATSATPVFVDVGQQAKATTAQAVVGHVQTGISMYAMESVVTQRPIMNPQTLDNGAIGLAGPGNPLFTNVLNPPMTTGWSKEGPLAYRSPVGDVYTYDPQMGTFATQGKSAPTNTQKYGNILSQFAGMQFYDSGAIIDTLSPLSYLPSSSGNGVTLTLGDGLSISTHDDGSASVTLKSGDIFKIANIKDPNYYTLSSEIQPNDYKYDTLWTQSGQAGEAQSETKYYKQDYQYTGNGGTYHYEYDYSGEYSGGSLSKDYGYIQDAKYKSDKPQIVEGSWTQLANGNTEGIMKQTTNAASNTRYGYNQPSSNYRYAFDQNSDSSGYSETKYTYDVKNNIYTNALKGNQTYSVDHDSSYGKFKFGDTYQYEGTTVYDQKNNSYKSDMNYRYKNGRDYTYQYEYDYKNGSYKNVTTDNNSGDQTTVIRDASGNVTSTKTNVKKEKEKEEEKGNKK